MTNGSLNMKLKTAIVLVLAGLCSQSYAELVVVGKNQANSNNQPVPNNSGKLPKSKPSNSTVAKNCNEMAMIARSAMTSRLDGERVHTIQAKVEAMYNDSNSPVKNDKTFNFLAHKVVLSAYSEKNIPPSNDLKARNALKNNFSHNQRIMCIEYLNTITNK